MTTNKEEKPLVSIKCLVYNHEDFITECLEGFVMQKTNFRFEAIVHDDCSTDSSVEIIRKYAEKYPDIIIPVYEKENLYSKNDGSLARAVNPHLNGKYIAMCEGDDYWTDPHKLQKQIDFLESHSDYSMVFSSCRILNTENLACSFKGENIENREYSSQEIFEQWTIPTASVVYRNGILNDETLNHPERFMYGDIAMFLECSHKGRIYGMRDPMTVYRIHGKGVSHDKNRYMEVQRRHPDHLECILDNFPKLDQKKLYRRLSSAFFHRAQKYDKITSSNFYIDLIKSGIYQIKYYIK